MLIILTSMITKVYSQAMTCDELIQYRDVTLLRAWDKEFRKYDAFASYRNTIQSEMLNLQKLNSSSNWGAVALAIKSVTDVLNNTLSLGNSIKMANKVAGNTDRLLKGIQVTRTGLDRAMDLDGGATVWELAGNQVLDMIPLVNSLKATFDNCKTYQQYESAKNEIQIQLNNCIQKLKAVELKLKDSGARLMKLNAIKTQIDIYLSKNCKKK